MDWFERQCKRKADALFIEDISFRAARHQIQKIAKKLHKFVKDEQRIALYSKNSKEMILYFFALQCLNKEVFLVNRHLSLGEVKRQIKNLQIEVVLSDDESFLSYAEVNKSAVDAVNPDFNFDHEQVAVIMNTSATSGVYKTVPIKWKQLYNHAKASGKRLGVCEADNWLIVLPLFHIGGFATIIRSLYNGTRVTVMEAFNPEGVATLINEGRINMLSLVPTMLKPLLDKINEHQLRVVLLSGEFIPEALVDKCLDKQIPIYKSYGMTEHTSQCTTFSVLDHLDKKDSVGTALANVEISIANKNDQGIGRVLIKSPMLMDGYIGSPPNNGFYDTGDIGYLDNEGFLFIYNRRSDLIISGGENIYPKEIENLVYQLLEVKECAVIGKSDEKWGQIPVLFVVTPLKAQVIEKYLQNHLASYKRPKQIIVCHGLPQNATGKILRKLLKERADNEN